MLQEHGITPISATRPDMKTVSREIAECEAAVTRDAGLSREAMEAAPWLRVLGNHGTGVDPVDVEFATEAGIAVVNTPGANAIAVAEHTVTLIMAALRRIPDAHSATQQGDFDFKYRTKLHELSGKSVGIVGYGHIGRAVARMLSQGFNADIQVLSESASADALAAEGYRKASSLQELIESSDIVSLHKPLTAATRGMIGREAMQWFKPDAVLVNTARGPLVDEDALVEALSAGRLGAAGLDVYHSEEIDPSHPLLNAPNLVLTPHTGGSTREALDRTATAVCGQVIDVLHDRRPDHLVNPAVWAHLRRPRVTSDGNRQENGQGEKR